MCSSNAALEVPNAFTVDVEEWFHVIDAAGAPPRADWGVQEPRVEAATERLLGLLGEADARATFFFLGWIAERYPGLVERVSNAGHEIATHGYAHDLVADLGPEGLREDLRRARGTLEGRCSRPVIGYRAASFSITPSTPWAFDVLAEEGFRYDSSIFPASRTHGGFSVDRLRPFRVVGPGGGSLWEFPIAPFDVGPLRIPFAGGGYLRLLPLPLLRLAARRLNRRGIPVMWYLHPREVDPDQPRMPLSAARAFRTYVNLRRTPAKVSALLASQRDLRPLCDLLEAAEAGAGIPTDPPLRLGH